MIGPESHIHHWKAPRKNHPENQKLMNPPRVLNPQRVLWKYLCDCKINALSVRTGWSNLKEEAHALQCTTAGPYNAIPTDLLRFDYMCYLGLDILGIHTLSLAARYRTTANSGELANGLTKVQAVREYHRDLFTLLLPNGKNNSDILRGHSCFSRVINLRIVLI